ncbi:DUF5997 family protein, partial [Streptomyces sp. SAS_270]|uniref:DUF5997 family protein n=1 Tax=Streptomyces sp. SAS_270 TaxID=3412748 RepID=UPI00403CF1BB
ISITGLTRGGITQPLTTEQIEALQHDMPEWLKKERTTQAEVRKETLRLKAKQQQGQQQGQPQNGTTR